MDDIDFSNSYKFEEKLQEVFNDNYKKIIIDFCEIEIIDCSGINKLFKFQKKLKEEDGNLIIRNVKSDYVKNIFNLVKLNKNIKIE